jgi:hypothetical protein
MEFRTTFSIPPSSRKITYNDPVMFIGSCFASSIGKQFEAGHMPVMINPSGTVYNPVSVCNTLETIISGRDYKMDDLYNNNGIWLSFNHYTDFSSDDPDQTLSRINRQAKDAGRFLSGAHFLFITFGTARVYRWVKTGRIVSNCHKIPAREFSHELLTVNDIVTMWNDQLDSLQSLFPALQVVFTISPVRHWKDGAHASQVSKSVLFLAVEELLKHLSGPGYFPAYELLMDDLRDYRFYDDDLLHPSSEATDYIWNAFTECWFDQRTSDLWKEVNKITKAVSHRITSGRGKEIKIFAEKMISEISKLQSRHAGLDLEKEKKYFLDLQGI